MKTNPFPIFCDIGITEECLFRCKMCTLWQSQKNNNELSVDEWKAFVDSLLEFGTRQIKLHFAGGEPLLKEGVFDIVEHANRHGFVTVMVTNGFLINEKIAEIIVSSGLDVLSLSLDSLDAKTHDFLRGYDGSCARLLQAIGTLKAKGAKSISILAVISGVNIGHISELVKWVNNNCALSSIYLQAVGHPIAAPKNERWYASQEFGFLWPSNSEQVNAVIDQLVDYKNQGYKISNSLEQLETFRRYFLDPLSVRVGSICTQGDYVVSIRPTGDVFLCGAMAPIGNIREEKLAHIWHSPEAESARKHIHQCQENCLVALNCFENKDLP